MKRKIIKFSTITLSVGIIGVLGLMAYVKLALPNVGDAPDITVELTQERIDRGEYLANHVTLCIDCHSERDWTLFTAPPVPGTIGGGGEVFDEEMDFPGRYVAPNITPSGIGNWTDGEVFRAITSGVNNKNDPLFPVMPYTHYGKMDEEDILSILAYIRTLEPVDTDIDDSYSNFPVNFIIHTMPEKAEFSKIPAPSDKIAYGEYMTNAAACYDCHTRQEKGDFIGEPFAGGQEFKLPNGTIVRSANLTPHETGIGSWDEASFIAKFKFYTDSAFVPHKVGDGEFQTIMPWMMYAGMTEEDLGAIFAYLQSLEPIDNTVEKFTATN